MDLPAPGIQPHAEPRRTPGMFADVVVDSLPTELNTSFWILPVLYRNERRTEAQSLCAR